MWHCSACRARRPDSESSLTPSSTGPSAGRRCCPARWCPRCPRCPPTHSRQHRADGAVGGGEGPNDAIIHPACMDLQPAFLIRRRPCPLPGPHLRESKHWMAPPAERVRVSRRTPPSRRPAPPLPPHQTTLEVGPAAGHAGMAGNEELCVGQACRWWCVGLQVVVAGKKEAVGRMEASPSRAMIYHRVLGERMACTPACLTVRLRGSEFRLAVQTTSCNTSGWGCLITDSSSHCARLFCFQTQSLAPALSTLPGASK